MRAIGFAVVAFIALVGCSSNKPSSSSSAGGLASLGVGQEAQGTFAFGGAGAGGSPLGPPVNIKVEQDGSGEKTLRIQVNLQEGGFSGLATIISPKLLDKERTNIYLAVPTKSDDHSMTIVQPDKIEVGVVDFLKEIGDSIDKGGKTKVTEKHESDDGNCTVMSLATSDVSPTIETLKYTMNSCTLEVVAEMEIKDDFLAKVKKMPLPSAMIDSLATLASVGNTISTHLVAK